jgi:purine nucleosidase
VKQIPVLLDTDPGVDDAMALALLARHPLAQLVGITTVYGNTHVEQTTHNALALCERMGLSVPVAQGASRPLLKPAGHGAEFVHGEGGLGGVKLPAAKRRPDPRRAATLISDLARAHSGDLVLVPVGPLTNIAIALNQDPELVRHVRRVVVMGGAFGTQGHWGNVSPFAEANIANDPHAADQVFAADWEVQIIGLDVTHQVLMDTAYLQALGAQGGDLGQLLYASSRHYEGFYNARTGGGIFSHDPTAAACALDPSLCTFREGPVRVVLDGPSEGQTLQALPQVAVPWGAWSGRRPQQVAVGVDAPRVLREFMGLIRGEGLS